MIFPIDVFFNLAKGWFLEDAIGKQKFQALGLIFEVAYYVKAYFRCDLLNNN